MEHNHSNCHTNPKTKRYRFILRVFLVCLYLYFIAISIIKPAGVISYTWKPYIWFPITTFVVFFEGRKYLKIYKQLWKKQYGMNTLVGISAHILYLFSTINAIINFNSSSYSYDVMWEGVGMLIIFVEFGEQIMQNIMHKSVSYRERLKSIKNRSVKVVRGGQELTTTIAFVKPNDIITLRHGDFVAIDGVALGNGIFNYENITGESKLVAIAKGNQILSGSFNSGDSIKMSVTKDFTNSYISEIITAINRFSKIRPRAQLFADKVLKYFVPIIFTIAFLTFLAFLIISQTASISLPWGAKINREIDFSQALFSGIAVVAVACPCAIGMATPIIYSITSIIASKNGIVINNPRAIEDLSDANAIAFDKTGTITEAQMKLVQLEGDKKWISVAKALEKDVNHPIAKAITSLPGDYASGVTNIKLVSNGISGTYQNKVVAIRTIQIGNNHTNLGLFVSNELKLQISLQNKVKNDVKTTITEFNKGFETVLISGDNKNVCLDVAKQIDIKKVFYEQKPVQKTNVISDLQNKGHKVAFVGDGFNDSPAMRKANISLAFASGSDITNSLSDISLINSDFKIIPKAFKISLLNNRWIKWSLFYAFLFNIIAIPLAIVGLLQPWLAAIIMSLSNILVGLNGFAYLQSGNKQLKKMK